MPVLPSAVFARGVYTATRESTRYGHSGYKGIILYLTVYSASGTGGIIPQLRRYDPEDPSQSRIMWSIPKPVTAVGTYDYIHHTDANEALASVYYIVPLPLPEHWTIVMTHLDSSPYEYLMTGSWTL